MVINIQGEKYLFNIVSLKERQLGSFYIRATCKLTKRTSCINNLNAILSEFDVDSANQRYVDSMWEVSVSEASRLLNISKKILKSKSFLNYLENKLDDDRDASEWENIFVSY